MPPNVKPVSDEAPPRYIEDLHESDQSVAILVPTKNNYSYLRLGDAPDKLEGGLNGDLAKLFKGEASVENMSPGFIHGPDGDLTDFAAEGGWFDLTDGNRASLTAKSKVEIIGENYKLITCNGDAGIDFSGGHLRMWSKSPGYLSKVEQSGDGATEEIGVGDRYSFRFIGGHYDESYLGTTYESYIGKASPHEPAGNALPHGDPAQGVDVPLGKYRQEIHASKMEEVFAAFVSSQKRTALWKIETEEAALTIDRKTKASLSIEQSDKVALAEVTQKVTPVSVEGTSCVGPASVEQRVSLSGVASRCVAPMYAHEFNGATYGDRILAASRSGFHAGTFAKDVRIHDVYQQMDHAKLRFDAFFGVVWIDTMMAGLHFEARGAKMSVCAAGINVVDMHVEQGLLHVII